MCNIVPGCIDELACNYNELATNDDSSCFYPNECNNYENDLSCVDDCGVPNGDNSTCLGCTNELADNYNAEAIVDDGSCIISGCIYQIL